MIVSRSGSEATTSTLTRYVFLTPSFSLYPSFPPSPRHLTALLFTDLSQIFNIRPTQQSLNSHRLPIFNDLTICLSGISSVPRRIEINRIVRAQGGEYTKVLERPVVVTHLLCGGDVGGGAAPEEEPVEEESQDISIAERSSRSKSKGKGKAKGKGKQKAGGEGADDGEEGDEVVETEKMKYARKFNKTGEAKIMMVWEEWFWDCLEFGGTHLFLPLPSPVRSNHSTHILSSQAASPNQTT